MNIEPMNDNFDTELENPIDLIAEHDIEHMAHGRFEDVDDTKALFRLRRTKKTSPRQRLEDKFEALSLEKELAQFGW